MPQEERRMRAVVPPVTLPLIIVGPDCARPGAISNRPRHAICADNRANKNRFTQFWLDGALNSVSSVANRDFTSSPGPFSGENRTDTNLYSYNGVGS
jgi:hypothetical protein